MKGKEVEIIKLLLENKAEKLSISQIARFLKKDYKNIHNQITRLVKQQIIKLDQFGGSYQVILSNKIHPLIFEAEYLRRRELLKNKDIAIMLETFKSLHSKLYIFLLFGSYAKKNQTKHSDIDLMCIVSDKAEEKMEKEINNIVHTLPLKIHMNIFKESDFKAMARSKEMTVGSEAIKNNIILYNIESYYEMLND